MWRSLTGSSCVLGVLFLAGCQAPHIASVNHVDPAIVGPIRGREYVRLDGDNLVGAMIYIYHGGVWTAVGRAATPTAASPDPNKPSAFVVVPPIAPGTIKFRADGIGGQGNEVSAPVPANLPPSVSGVIAVPAMLSSVVQCTVHGDKIFPGAGTSVSVLSLSGGPAPLHVNAVRNSTSVKLSAIGTTFMDYKTYSVVFPNDAAFWHTGEPYHLEIQNDGYYGGGTVVTANFPCP